MSLPPSYSRILTPGEINGDQIYPSLPGQLVPQRDEQVVPSYIESARPELIYCSWKTGTKIMVFFDAMLYLATTVWSGCLCLWLYWFFIGDYDDYYSDSLHLRAIPVFCLFAFQGLLALYLGARLLYVLCNTPIFVPLAALTLEQQEPQSGFDVEKFRGASLLTTFVPMRKRRSSFWAHFAFFLATAVATALYFKIGNFSLPSAVTCVWSALVILSGRYDLSADRNIDQSHRAPAPITSTSPAIEPLLSHV